SNHIQGGLMLMGSQDNGLNAHDHAVSYKDEDGVPLPLNVWVKRCRYGVRLNEMLVAWPNLVQ
ncbi:MAG: hypothetical protein ABL983_24495, partial [Nitrospira sp.]